MLAYPDFNFIAEKANVMAVLYFYSDESGKYRKDPVITVSGVGAQSDRLDKFNKEWTSLLRANHIRELKMSRIFDLTQSHGPKMPAGQSTEDRIQAILPFADCVNNHLEIGLIQGWDVKGYNNLSLDVKRGLGGSPDPFYLCFVRAILHLDDYLRDGDTLSIICDDDELTAWDAYCHYRRIGQSQPKLNKKLSGITFARSHFFTPLQAADMVAFLTRKEASKRFWGKPNQFDVLLSYLAAGPKPGSGGIMNWYEAFIDEQGFVDLTKSLAAEGLIKDSGQTNGVPEIRQHNATAYSGSAQQNQSQAGRRKGSKKAEAELARQCSESSRLLFERLGADLDRKMGAALAALRARVNYRGEYQQPKSSSHAGDVGMSPVVSASPESPQVPDSSGDRFP